MDPSITQEGKIYSDLCGQFINMSNKDNMYVYNCNVILKNSTKIRGDKDMIRDLTELTTDIKTVD